MKQATHNSTVLPEVKDLVSEVLKKFIDDKIVQSSLIDDNYVALWKSIAHLSESGGKRLRPYMTYVAYRLYGGENTAGILSVAAAQELLHLGMLVHDDIIDRDYQRYGVKNMHGMYEDIYSPLLRDKGERYHYASSAALLSGDLLLSAAFDICLESSLTDAQKLIAQKYLANSIFNVVGGELLDTESSFRPRDEIDPLKIALLKTSSYSFIAPLAAGATIAGADEDELKHIHRFGEALGIAFQLADDLLGVFGDEEVTGKSTSSDIAEGKYTLLVKEALAKADDNDRERLDALLGKHDISADELDEVRAIFVRSGSKAAIEKSIEEYTQKAHEALANLSGNSSYQQELVSLISLATKRVK